LSSSIEYRYLANQGPNFNSLLTDAVLITAVVATGRADTILKAARDVGAPGGIVHLARGTGARERLGMIGIAVEAEKEVVSFVAAAEHQDLIAEAVYHAGGMHAPGGGYLYITAIDRLATYIPEQARDRMERQE
jgi:nitrogen regulatory protein PII